MLILEIKIGLYEHIAWKKCGDFSYLKHVLPAVAVINSAS
jgi:hypothetical protein